MKLSTHATNGSEFVAACVCIEKIIDLCHMLRYLGVPIRDKWYMFGDNKSVVDSSMQLMPICHVTISLCQEMHLESLVSTSYGVMTTQLTY
jgi:hypothetical protein